MGLLSSLESLIGIHNNQSNQGLVNGYKPQPGQYDAAVRYAANPTSPEFLNVDPKLFGYPADNTVSSFPSNAARPAIAQQQGQAIPLLQLLSHLSQVNLNSSGLGNAPADIQGGTYNPGYVPLQTSGFGGPGYTANLQPANRWPQGPTTF